MALRPHSKRRYDVFPRLDLDLIVGPFFPATLLEQPQRPRFGYRRLHVLLRDEGEKVNHKRVWRVYKALDLTVRKKTRSKRAVQRRTPPTLPSKANERWSMDFVSDQLAIGQRFRVLNVVDDFARECIVCFADTSITGEAVARLLGEAVKERGKP